MNFDGKVCGKMVEKMKGTKVKAKVFTCPDLQVSRIVENHFNYKYEDGYVFNLYWAINDDLFPRKAVFSLLPYPGFAARWDWPAGLPQGAEPPN